MTRRAVLIGLTLSAIISVWPAYSSMIVRSSRADYAHLSVAFLVPFVILLLMDLVAKRRGSGLSSSELITICCIGALAANTQGEWLSGCFLGTISSPTYFATPENRWDELLLARLPPWTIVSDPEATTGFYEGLPDGRTIPWRVWAVPLLWWGSFFGALLVANLCVLVILRKQWMENERLAFPIATALLQMTGGSRATSTFQTLIASRLFRVEFFTVLGIFAWNTTTWFVTAIPPLPVMTRHQLFVARGFPSALIVVHPMTMAFAYFTKSDVLLSLWVFQIFSFIQAGLFNRVGFSIGASDPWGSFDASTGWQSFGGMIVFVAWGMWIGRSHLSAVIRQAWTGERTVDDSGELLSYRTAVWLLAGSALFLVFWLRGTGMDWAPLMAFWFGTAILYIGLARIIVESGLVILRGPITAQAFTWHLVGVGGVGPASAAVLGLTYTFFCDGKTLGMTALAHVARLSQEMEMRGRRLLVPVVLLGAVVGTVAVVGFTLYEGYHAYGSFNFGVVTFTGSNNGPVGVWQISANRIQQGTSGTDWNRLTFLGIGGLFTALVLYLRYLIPTFPISPIGFAISPSGVLQSSLLSILLVWGIKTILLRIGGLERYRQTAPLFLGMLIGHAMGLALGVVVDTIWFNGSGHSINRW